MLLTGVPPDGDGGVRFAGSTDVPRPLRSICLKALAESPGDRYDYSTGVRCAVPVMTPPVCVRITPEPGGAAMIAARAATAMEPLRVLRGE